LTITTRLPEVDILSDASRRNAINDGVRQLKPYGRNPGPRD
jgi:hypothetical protein